MLSVSEAQAVEEVHPVAHGPQCQQEFQPSRELSTRGFSRTLSRVLSRERSSKLSRELSRELRRGLSRGLSRVRMDAIDQSEQRVSKEKVRELAHRGVELRSLLDFWDDLVDGCTAMDFSPEATTNDVVRQAVIPASATADG